MMIADLARTRFMDHAPSGHQLSQRFPADKAFERPVQLDVPLEPPEGRGVLFI